MIFRKFKLHAGREVNPKGGKKLIVIYICEVGLEYLLEDKDIIISLGYVFNSLERAQEGLQLFKYDKSELILPLHRLELEYRNLVKENPDILSWN